jgi:hypothetical protein
VSHDATNPNGEPNIAIDPRHAGTVVVSYSRNTSQGCVGAITRNGGASWRPLTYPTFSSGQCTDNIVAFGPDGTLYAGGIQSSVDAPVNVITSHDLGRTWSQPVAAVSLAKFRAALPPGDSTGSPGFASPNDRPFFAVDASTGKIYVSSIDHGNGLLDVHRTSGFFGGGSRLVTVSKDGGKTYGPLRKLDSDEYPDQGFGSVAAAHGRLAAAYVVHDATATSRPPFVVFETSTDDGTTWRRNVVPEALPGALAEEVIGAYVAADPTRAGHYAVAVKEDGGNSVRVHVTSDGGKTWTRSGALGPSVPGTLHSRLWLAYGPDGALGVVWRLEHLAGDETCAVVIQNVGVQHCAYDVVAAVSPKGDTHFGAGVALTPKTTTPPANYFAGDDVTHVQLDGRFLYAAFGYTDGSGDMEAMVAKYGYRGRAPSTPSRQHGE